MTVPTLKQQRQTDLGLLYDEALPWVQSAETPGVAESFYVRAAERERETGDHDGHPRRRDTMIILVRKTDWPDPATNTSVTIEGVAWRVDTVAQENPWEWRILLASNVRHGF